VAVEHEGGRHLVLKFDGARGPGLVWPLSMMAKRVDRGEAIDVHELFEGICQSVEQARSGALGDRLETVLPPKPTPAASERPVLLSARGIAKAYRMGGTRLEVLKGVDLEIRDGEVLAILGKSGCGKSTLLHVLGWLDRADAGEIRYEGQDRNALPASERARQRNRVMGFVFQFYHLMPELSALENALLPAMIRDDVPWRKRKGDATERAKALLAMVGLGSRLDHRPSQLSGGERQRVAIARALINQPRFLLCDEPTGNLDGRTAEDVRALLWGLNRTHGQTMVIVTHDAKLAAEAHRVVHLVDGRVATGAGEAAPVVEIER
jgi:lipoprotein-releasing system ATP-binding protein